MDICDLCTSCLIETYEFFVIYKKSETYFLSLLDSSGQSAIKIESIDLPMNHDTSEQPLETEYMAIEEAPESIHFDVKTEYEEDEEEDANEQIDSEPEAGDDWFSAGNVSDGSSEEHEEDEVENEAVEYEVANDSEPEHAKESKKTVPKGSSKRKVICDICGKILTGSTRLDVHKSKFDAIEWEFQINNFISTGYHTGERPFPCKECDKSFHTEFGLERHSQVHPGGDRKCELMKLKN